MPNDSFDIGVVTDEVSRDLAEALAVSRSWGLSRFELREGDEQRFPFFSKAEIGLVEKHRETGARILTGASPPAAPPPSRIGERLHRAARTRLPID